MTLLYSLNKAYPALLPFRVSTPNGLTRTDPSTFTEEELSEWGYAGPFVEPAFDPDTQYLEWDGSDFVVRSKTTEELNLETLEQWQRVRDNRLVKLRNSDWTQLPDAPVDKQAWALYRQQLRDITLQDNPDSIVWPQEPITPPIL
jgi:hypothetical protein